VHQKEAARKIGAGREQVKKIPDLLGAGERKGAHHTSAESQTESPHGREGGIQEREKRGGKEEKCWKREKKEKKSIKKGLTKRKRQSLNGYSALSKIGSSGRGGKVIENRWEQQKTEEKKEITSLSELRSTSFRVNDP